MFLALMLVALFAASCSVKYQAPKVDETELVRTDVKLDSTVKVEEISWKEFYQDPYLTRLIDSALVHNMDMRTAVLRMEQAGAYFKQSKWNYVPNLNANAGVSYGVPTLGANQTPYYTLGVTMSWEIDITGKMNQLKKSKFEAFLAQQNIVRQVQTQLIANVAGNYYYLKTLDVQKTLIEQTIINRARYLATVEAFWESGKSNEVAVLQAKAQLISAKEYLYQVNETIFKIENGMRILLGTPAGKIERATEADVETMITAVAKMGSMFETIPATFLSNRPDVAAAENSLKSALHNFNVAKKAMYPSLNITGNISSDATQFNNWFSVSPSSWLWNIGAGLVQPILNNRQLRTNKEVAWKEYEIAQQTFKTTVLNAGMEVSNVVNALETNELMIVAEREKVFALAKAYDSSIELFVNDYATYLDVLTAETGLFDAQMSFVDEVRQYVTNKIELYRALGGGDR